MQSEGANRPPANVFWDGSRVLHRDILGFRQIALSPTFRALDTHDLRRGLRRTGPNRTLAHISRTRHARSLQRAAFRGAPAAAPGLKRKSEEDREVKM